MAAKITAAPLTKSGQFFYLLDIGTGFKEIFPKTIHYSSSGKAHLKQHILSVHESKMPFKCDICQSTFTKKSSLKTHIRNIHEEKF